MAEKELVLLDHGSGGVLSSNLIEKIIVPGYADQYVGTFEDSTTLCIEGERIAMTTDSFVINPIFFGNGDIGKLSVCGTVNDLAVSGSRPMYISVAMIIEESFPIESLSRISLSIGTAASIADVKIACGDTKVVGRGEIDGIMINTTGIGCYGGPFKHRQVKDIKAGDAIILTGRLGDHGLHIISLREGLGFERQVLSDCAALNGMLKEIAVSIEGGFHAARDVTRGGLATVLNEISLKCDKMIRISRKDIPMKSETEMGCRMLDVDPLFLANEGCVALFVCRDRAEEALAVCRKFDCGEHAGIVGYVSNEKSGGVLLEELDGLVVELRPLEGRVLARLC